MNDARIHLYYPRGLSTGGPELLHQACHLLRAWGHDAYLVPAPGTESIPRSPDYTAYDAPEAQPADDDRTTVVAYENLPLRVLLGFRHAQKVLWWLSLDNAWLYRGGALRSAMRAEQEVAGLRNEFALQRWGVGPLSWYEAYLRRRVRGRDDITHLAQCDYVAQRIAADLACTPRMLSDYVVAAEDVFDNGRREPLIAYNPRKGGRLVEMVIEQAPRSWRFVPVAGLDRSGVSDLLRTASAYLDMGHQPGRDRLPREAAKASAPVVLLARGAAAYDLDCPLPDAYRLPFVPGALERTVDALADVLADPAAAARAQQGYRDWALGDRARFEQELAAVFGRPDRS